MARWTVAIRGVGLAITSLALANLACWAQESSGAWPGGYGGQGGQPAAGAARGASTWPYEVADVWSTLCRHDEQERLNYRRQGVQIMPHRSCQELRRHIGEAPDLLLRPEDLIRRPRERPRCPFDDIVDAELLHAARLFGTRQSAFYPFDLDLARCVEIEHTYQALRDNCLKTALWPKIDALAATIEQHGIHGDSRKIALHLLDPAWMQAAVLAAVYVNGSQKTVAIAEDARTVWQSIAGASEKLADENPEFEACIGRHVLWLRADLFDQVVEQLHEAVERGAPALFNLGRDPSTGRVDCRGDILEDTFPPRFSAMNPDQYLSCPQPAAALPSESRRPSQGPQPPVVPRPGADPQAPVAPAEETPSPAPDLSDHFQ
ncbi:MAG: hypothetical protein HY814_08680 [Candidatus Riflebacteria bacterium]|nr:hypothetical protein [Candidatus Riflebacteria bacterium]